MRHVATNWLIWLRRGLLLYSCHLAAGYLYNVFFLSTGIDGGGGYTLVLFAITLPHLLYELGASLWLINKSPYALSVVTMTLATLETFIVLVSSGSYGSPYVLAVLALAFIASAYGTYFSPPIIFLTVLGYVLGIGGVLNPNTETPVFQGGVVVLLTVFSAAVGYSVWRRYYTLEDADPEVSRLHSQLQSRQLQSEVLIQAIADGIIVCDTDGKITLMNPAAATMSGWGMDEAISIDVRLVMKLTSDEGKQIDKEQDPFTVVLANREHVSQTLKLADRSGGHTIDISLVVSPVVAPGSDEIMGIVAVFRDISTARKEEHQRAEFISTASHEMRTPVAAIEGYLALALNEKVSRIDSRARDYLEKAHSSAQHLGHLFQDLLTSAKAEDGRLTSHPVVVEMGDFVEHLVEDLRFAADKKGLAMEFIIGTSQDGGQVIDASQGAASTNKVLHPLYYTLVDPDRMREVVTNLFDNAVKYTDSGKISIGLTGDTDVVQIYIRDTGAGIPAEDVPHLFQKFYRVDNSSTRTIGGTGLGLFICRKIVELYQGRIWVDSKPGVGSTFFINLPRIDNQKASDLKAKEAAQSPYSSNLSSPPGHGTI